MVKLKLRLILISRQNINKFFDMKYIFKNQPKNFSKKLATCINRQSLLSVASCYTSGERHGIIQSRVVANRNVAMETVLLWKYCDMDTV